CAGLGAARRGYRCLLGSGGGPLPDGVRGEPPGVHRALRPGRDLPHPWDRRCRARLYRATAPQAVDDGTGAEPASALVRLVASTDPARISEKPTTAPTVNGSWSKTTPSSKATAGLKQVITLARTGPTALLSAKNGRKPSAVHTTAGGRTASRTFPDGIGPGRRGSATGA